MQLIWLRTDLRVADNTALHAAMRNGPTVALFVLTPRQWQLHDDAPCKVDFWLRNLEQLRTDLQQLNVPLLVRHCDDWSGVPDLLGRLCHELHIDAVHLNDEYGINEQRRDQQVATRLMMEGVTLHRHLDQLLFQPGSLLTRAGDYFKVYSQFRNLCLQHLRAAPPQPRGRPQAQAPLPIASDKVPAQLDGWQAPDASLRAHWPAGEEAALAALASFTDEHMQDYAEQRDIPSAPGTSLLSPYLAAGVLSPRQCLHAALSCNQGEFDTGNDGAITWINELLWREFYKHILVGYPRVSRHRAFRPQTEALPWRNAPQDLQAWQEGRTGLPIIDAAMRQLHATGWMHNRLRMVVAMFLSKNLLIDWREGERFFMRHLIDGDLAANNGGWQWSASTGTDAVPYFRLFNPISQSQRFDPKGRFIRHWLPELTSLSDKAIHSPPVGDLFCSVDYPAPILDLAASRERALAAFRDLP
ncbi:deoxyribodipyrimidine photo-lyase [Pseudomonas sp. ABC1]|uniref:deoxyribodipyrimidine photo-lyase n=1 Tax=Pseudomonas sp. ABC1 TaxID=2748080 RepID=UPI0015C31F09|nr:deoxyribodipyrimidine photo-lyase [Pseudomonas sp. ABC1]QLF91726.1 deoxyribodipyrimidine photo-lyase [Pseudomonas sp. ABC1]